MVGYPEAWYVFVLGRGAVADSSVIFVDNSDPYAEDLDAMLHESEAAVLAANSQNHNWNSGQHNGMRVGSVDGEAQQGLEALSTAATHDRYSHPALGVEHHQQSIPADSVSPFNPSIDVPSSVSSGPSPSQTRSTLPPQASPPVSISSSSSIHNTNTINFLLNPSHSISPPVDPGIQSPGRRSSSLTARRNVSRTPKESRSNVQAETDFEVTFLLRHYTEWPGRW